MPSIFIEDVEVNKLTTINDVSEYLSAYFPTTVKCQLNLDTRKAYIGRMEVVLKGNIVIPSGWRGKIVLLQGINRRITLTDTIVLPMILPGVITPIMPGVADIPYDIVKAITLEDEWKIEFYIVDPYDNEKLVLRSNATIILPDDTKSECEEEKGNEQHKERDKNGENQKTSNFKQCKLIEKLQRVEEKIESLNQQARNHGKSYKIVALKKQIQIFEKRVNDFIPVLEAINPITQPEKLREVELKIERYSEEIGRLEEKLKLLKG